MEGVTYAHQVAWIRWGHWDQGYFLKCVKNTKHMLDGSGIRRHVTVTALLLEAAGYDIIMSVSLPLSIVFRRR